MVTKRLAIAVIAGLILTMLLSVSAGAFKPPPLPHVFHGKVIINGRPAPDGTKVQARIDGVVCGEATTFTDGFGPGTYSGLSVASSGEKAGCGDPGDIIEFWVQVGAFGFFKAPQTAMWQEGGSTRLDLILSIPLAVGGYADALSPLELLAPWMLLLAGMLSVGVIATVSLKKRGIVA